MTEREDVLRAAEGMDAIVNLSVVRQDPRLAFRVNMLGCYHVMQASARHHIRRVINTGPHFTVAGPKYEGIDFAIPPDVPPHPGTGLYPLSKSLGHEVCRILAEARYLRSGVSVLQLARNRRLGDRCRRRPLYRFLARRRRSFPLGTGDRFGPVADAIRSVLHLGRPPKASSGTTRRNGSWVFAPATTCPCCGPRSQGD